MLNRSSLDINLLPESEEDKNLASLLALRPSRSIEESHKNVRTKILNSPALPSSSGLITSFGGLKKEESLSKSSPLTRNILGITIKRNKDSTECSTVKKSECKNVNKSTDKCPTVNGDSTDVLKKNKKISLVGDYGSSGESSEG